MHTAVHWYVLSWKVQLADLSAWSKFGFPTCWFNQHLGKALCSNHVAFVRTFHSCLHVCSYKRRSTVESESEAELASAASNATLSDVEEDSVYSDELGLVFFDGKCVHCSHRPGWTWMLAEECLLSTSVQQDDSRGTLLPKQMMMSCD